MWTGNYYDINHIGQKDFHIFTCYDFKNHNHHFILEAAVVVIVW